MHVSFFYIHPVPVACWACVVKIYRFTPRISMSQVSLSIKTLLEKFLMMRTGCIFNFKNHDFTQNPVSAMGNGLILIIFQGLLALQATAN